MQHYLIVGVSSGIGQELTSQLKQSGNQVKAIFPKIKPHVEISNIRFLHLNVLKDTFPLDLLPHKITGFAYCSVRINLWPFRRIKLEDFKENYTLQVIGAEQILHIDEGIPSLTT